MLVVRRTVGRSMSPMLQPDRIVLGWRRCKILTPGMIVIVRHNGIEKVKRIHQVSDEAVFVVGDNPAESTDSRQYGWLPRGDVIAKVIWPR